MLLFERGPMADYIEGRRPVLEAMRSGMPLKYILMADNVKRDGLVADLLRKAKNLDVPVRQISKKKLDEMSERGSHQGFIAESRPFEYVNGTFLLNAAKDYAEAHEGRALIVVCDHLTDAGNLGAVAAAPRRWEPAAW